MLELSGADRELHGIEDGHVVVVARPEGLVVAVPAPE